MMLCRKDSSPAVGGLAEFRGLLICARITILWKQNTIMSHGATGCPNAIPTVGRYAYLIWMIFTTDALLDTIPKAYVVFLH